MFIGTGRNSNFSRIWLHRLAAGYVPKVQSQTLENCVVVGCRVESDSVLVLA